jgi:hypothetical protein
MPIWTNPPSTPRIVHSGEWVALDFMEEQRNLDGAGKHNKADKVNGERNLPSWHSQRITTVVPMINEITEALLYSAARTKPFLWCQQQFQQKC